jgi:ABC-2 type transport system permease protein
MLQKIWLVTKREYTTRVRKKSFIIMTIAAPLLMVLFYGIIIYVSINKDIGSTTKNIYVSDKNGTFANKLTNSELMHFTFGYVPDNQRSTILNDENYFALLHIPDSAIEHIHQVQLYSKEQASFGTVMQLENMLENEVKNELLKANGIDDKTLQSINKNKLSVKTIKFTDKGMESSSVEFSTIIGYLGAIIIYFFIFIYGVQIMRGVIEEKSNRIVEVIISSIKPFELMMGKIAGIAFVGLTQFIIWVLIVTVLGSSVSGLVMGAIGADAAALNPGGATPPSGGAGEILQALLQFNFTYFIGMFLFYFIGGYLFYGSLFAAIGSAVDSETDTQQFMLPITMPLVLALVLAQSVVVSNPNGDLAVWLSIIPFTAPVIMMVRLPFDVPFWQVIVSMVSLTAGFIVTTWIAGRIYRVGILMYGQKPSYKKIARWLFSKD